MLVQHMHMIIVKFMISSTTTDLSPSQEEFEEVLCRFQDEYTDDFYLVLGEYLIWFMMSTLISVCLILSCFD